MVSSHNPSNSEEEKASSDRLVNDLRNVHQDPITDPISTLAFQENNRCFYFFFLQDFQLKAREGILKRVCVYDGIIGTLVSHCVHQYDRSTLNFMSECMATMS